jgi:hypothetical protein
MADINIKDLLDRKILGNDLFSDSESFMIELDDEVEHIIGSLWEPPLCYADAYGDGNTAFWPPIYL